ncbi:hypothetical protein JAAARDRAFT_200453 [Jaapia argillacea MUCL 33604]|uniref:Uncharacterized protein n=1 Tax=Jaapia argillacea MUCL 33604 TaxID=933084 RepID=A0A067P517_9AGAM|nr:hypothetical protein JAAARDRAFT_200453 [Jaapia argillacea MUCL 33604]
MRTIRLGRGEERQQSAPPERMVDRVGGALRVSGLEMREGKSVWAVELDCDWRFGLRFPPNLLSTTLAASIPFLASSVPLAIRSEVTGQYFGTIGRFSERMSLPFQVGTPSATDQVQIAGD